MHMMKAFVVSSPRDYWQAENCVKMMTTYGWDAVTMVDPSEWEVIPEGAVCASYATTEMGQYGNRCAEGIVDGILAHSEGFDTVLKMDCDVVISPEFSEWLKTPESARCFRIEKRNPTAWGGLWSAKRSHLLLARDFLPTMNRCKCAEAALILYALNKTGGLDIHESTRVIQFDEVNRDHGVLTLPLHTATPRDTIAKNMWGSVFDASSHAIFT
jgi:hypothetical protein